VTQFPVNPHRQDPYKQFKFRVRWEGRYVAGISKITGLVRNTDVVSWRCAGETNVIRKLPGLTSFEPITLERGITHDSDFEEWANQVWDLGATPGSEMSLKNYRKDIAIELYNEAGQLAIAYMVYRCWPSEYVALPELDGNSACVAIESITLEHEGWERDLEVTEPVET